MQAGNKPGQSLNKEGYENLIRKFAQRTGISYERDQFKNHWDSMRKDWQTWKALQKETGLGWSEEKGTYEMSNDWWISFAQEEINEPEEEGTPQVYGTPEQESPHLSGATNDQPQGSGFHTFSSYQTQTTSSQFYGSEFVRDTYTPSPTSAGPRPCPPQKKSKTSAGQKWEKSLDRE
ncbi:hypothetical protein QJS10_CPA16g00820 [Acorus calamus]|uniref:Myb/SANT-like domain-containing protein n=1 Tax=Acorus calamus TaxID=4465 RepID=A0AAV9CXD9_ACOCL|nr:hypothetical protein QJS10_CPA16g00820 [Acorus calamus]